MAVTYSATRASPVKIGYKDPDAILDYAVLWQDWLATDEILVSQTIEATTGITVVSSEINDTALTLNSEEQKIGSVVTIWLSGGTIGSTYTIACLITTSVGRKDERSFNVLVRER